MPLVNKIKDGFSYVKTYWKTPPLGNYMPIKEIAALAGGGMGIRFITQCVSSVLLSATNVFVGNTIGIEPMNLYYIYLIAVVVSFPLTMVRAYIVDNTRNKKGKYRPYLISMGIPTVLLSIGYFWMPYEKMESQVTKCIVVLLFNIGFQFFYNFLYEAYYNYVVVLSPNTQETLLIWELQKNILHTIHLLISKALLITVLLLYGKLKKPISLRKTVTTILQNIPTQLTLPYFMMKTVIYGWYTAHILQVFSLCLWMKQQV